MIFANIELYPTFSRPAIFVFQACILFCAFCIKLGRRSRFFCLFFVKLAGPDTSDTPAMRTRIPRLRQKKISKNPQKSFYVHNKILRCIYNCRNRTREPLHWLPSFV